MVDGASAALTNGRHKSSEHHQRNNAEKVQAAKTALDGVIKRALRGDMRGAVGIRIVVHGNKLGTVRVIVEEDVSQ